VRTTEEKAFEAEALGVPTFRKALGQDIAHRTTARALGKARMIEATSKDYQQSFDKHLGK